MQDRDFEKQVQQKMQELRFAPGADVWARVRADIQKKKRRRPVVLWLILAGLLVGSSWFLYTGMQNDNKITGQLPSDKSGSASNEKSEETTTITNPQTQKTTSGTSGEQSLRQPENGTKTSIEKDKVVKSAVTEEAGNKTVSEKALQKPQSTESKFKPLTSGTSKKDQNRSISDYADKGEQKAANKNLLSTNRPVTVNNEINSLPPQAKTEAVVKPAENIIEKPVVQKEEQVTPDSRKPDVSQPMNPDTKVAIASDKDPDKKTNVEVQVKDSLTSPASPAIAMKNNSVKKKAGQRSDWQIGISGSIGISDLGNEIFKGTSVADLAYGGGAVTPAAPPIQRASEVQAGLAFNLGGYVSKSIAKKLRLKLGLEYDYFSNVINTGSYVNSTRVVNQGAALNLVNEFYIAGNTNKFTNRYHFISVPLSLQWQINKSTKHGLIWENGISPAQMIHTNALHYDGISGTYYEEDNLFRKTQWIASSSLLFSLKLKNNLQLYAGPQVQYGLSNMVDKAEKNKHLRYAGIKLMVGFNN
ncbi:MAG TPA: hypothetical protein VGD17_20490 [Chitinophagaceae bacterium]